MQAHFLNALTASLNKEYLQTHYSVLGEMFVHALINIAILLPNSSACKRTIGVSHNNARTHRRLANNIDSRLEETRLNINDA